MIVRRTSTPRISVAMLVGTTFLEGNPTNKLTKLPAIRLCRMV